MVGFLGQKRAAPESINAQQVIKNFMLCELANHYHCSMISSHRPKPLTDLH